MNGRPRQSITSIQWYQKLLETFTISVHFNITKALILACDDALPFEVRAVLSHGMVARFKNQLVLHYAVTTSYRGATYTIYISLLEGFSICVCKSLISTMYRQMIRYMCKAAASSSSNDKGECAFLWLWSWKLCQCSIFSMHSFLHWFFDIFILYDAEHLQIEVLIIFPNQCLCSKLVLIMAMSLMDKWFCFNFNMYSKYVNNNY